MDRNAFSYVLYRVNCITNKFSQIWAFILQVFTCRNQSIFDRSRKFLGFVSVITTVLCLFQVSEYDVKLRMVSNLASDDLMLCQEFIRQKKNNSLGLSNEVSACQQNSKILRVFRTFEINSAIFERKRAKNYPRNVENFGKPRFVVHNKYVCIFAICLHKVGNIFYSLRQTASLKLENKIPTLKNNFRASCEFILQSRVLSEFRLHGTWLILWLDHP